MAVTRPAALKIAGFWILGDLPTNKPATPKPRDTAHTDILPLAAVVDRWVGGLKHLGNLRKC